MKEEGSRRALVLKIVVSGLCIGYLGFRYGRDAAFRETLGRLSPVAFAVALGVLGLGLVLSALRWKVLLAAAGVPLPLGRSIRLYFLGYFFNFFLPTTVGGDVARALGFGRGTPLAVVGGSILVERLLGFGCLLAIGLTASLAVASLAVARNALLLATAIYVAGVVVLLLVPLPETRARGRLGRLLGGLRRTALEVRAYGFHPRALAAGLGLSLGWQLALVAANGVLSRGLGGIAPLGSLAALVPVVQAITMIPVSVGGLGVREMGYEFFFRTAGYDAAGGVALGVGFLGVSIALALIGGVVYLVAPIRRGDG